MGSKMQTSIKFCDGSFVTVSCEKVLANNMRTCHSHGVWELYFLAEGERYLYVDGRFYRLRAGDAFLAAPGVMHRTLDEGGYTKFVAMLPKSLIPASFFEPFKIVRTGREEYTAVLSEIADLERDPTDTRCLYTVMKLLFSVMTLPWYGEAAVESPAIGRIGAILDYLETHFTEKISLTSLAERFYISEYYLCRLFKEYMGRSFTEYVSYLRVERAKILLLDGIPASRVWRMSGFGSESSFNRVFKECVGVSAREWKNRDKENYGAQDVVSNAPFLFLWKLPIGVGNSVKTVVAKA